MSGFLPSDIHSQSDSSGMICVSTRFRLPHPWTLLRFIWTFRRVGQSAEAADGLLSSSLLIEDWRTVYIVSLWQSKDQMDRWVGVPAHVRAVQASYGKMQEVWSGRWSLDAVSPSACSWAALEGQTHQRNAVEIPSR